MRILLLQLPVLLLCASFFGYVQPLNSWITLENGYTGIIITIDRKTPESTEMLENLKEFLTDSSEYLFQVLNRTTYIKQVMVVVPDTWKLKGELVYDIYQEADIRIEDYDRSDFSLPYSIQTDGCGKAGQFISFPVNSLRKWKTMEHVDKLLTVRTFAREWLKFRYGVFDEHGTPGHGSFPAFIGVENKRIPVSCTANVTGRFLRTTDRTACSFRDDHKECTFVPDRNVTIKASLMSANFFKHVEGLCDDNNHNEDIPNPQNHFCKKRSIWKTIKEHPDFRRGKDYLNVAFQKPVVKIVKGTERKRFALLLDYSYVFSNLYIKRYDDMVDLIKALIIEGIPEGSEVSLFLFNNTLTTLKRDVVLDDAGRRLLLNSIPRESGQGPADIRLAILKMISELKQKPGNVVGVTAYIITRENFDPYEPWSKLNNRLLKEMISFNVIYFGEDSASSSLHTKVKRVARNSRGKLYYFQDGYQETERSDLLHATVKSFITDTYTAKRKTQVYYEHVSVPPGGGTYKILVDANKKVGVVQRIHVSVTAANIAESVLNFLIRTPSGDVLTLKSHGKRPTNNSAVITTDHTQDGEYVLALVNYHPDQTQTATLLITEERSPANPNSLTVTAWTESHAIWAMLRQDGFAVISANVTATMVTTEGEIQHFTLRDNGAGADFWKDDGVYSAFFKPTRRGRRYYSFVQVEYQSTTRKVKLGYLPDFLNFQRNIQYSSPNGDNKQESSVDASLFPQIVYAGDMNEYNVDCPFNGIHDLQVLNITMLDEKRAKVEIQWTSPGGCFHIGKPGNYTVKICETISLTKCVELTDENIISGSLAPASAGTLQVIAFEIHVDFFDKTSEGEIQAFMSVVSGFPGSNPVPVYFNFEI